MAERREPTISSARPEFEEGARRKSTAESAVRPNQHDEQAEVPRSGNHSSSGSHNRSSGSHSSSGNQGLHADIPRSREPSHGSARPPAASSSKSGPFALFLALIAIAASGFLYWQSVETQKVLQKTLSESEARIVELESKLALTGDEASASVTALQAKLKWADSEIRKLWAVSYDTNRKAIADNVDAITEINKQMKGIDGKVKNATKNVETDVKLLNELVDTQQVSLAQIEQKMTAVKTSAEKMIQENTALTKRIERNEQAIEAIDAFRRTVNQQLLQLKGTTP